MPLYIQCEPLHLALLPQLGDLPAATWQHVTIERLRGQDPWPTDFPVCLLTVSVHSEGLMKFNQCSCTWDIYDFSAIFAGVSSTCRDVPSKCQLSVARSRPALQVGWEECANGEQLRFSDFRVYNGLYTVVVSPKGKNTVIRWFGFRGSNWPVFWFRRP